MKICDLVGKSASSRKLAEIAHDSITDSIQQQRADLRSIRSQASVVAAVSGLIANYFSQLVIKGSENRGISVFDLGEPNFVGLNLSLTLAVIAFMASIAFSLRILLPSDGWRFESSPKVMLEKLRFCGKDFDDEELLIRLAREKEQRFDKNEEKLAGVHGDLFFAVVCAVAQAPLWVSVFMLME